MKPTCYAVSPELYDGLRRLVDRIDYERLIEASKQECLQKAMAQASELMEQIILN